VDVAIIGTFMAATAKIGHPKPAIPANPDYYFLAKQNLWTPYELHLSFILDHRGISREISTQHQNFTPAVLKFHDKTF